MVHCDKVIRAAGSVGIDFGNQYKSKATYRALIPGLCN